MIHKFDFHTLAQMLVRQEMLAQWTAEDYARHKRVKQRLTALGAAGATHAVLFTNCDTSDHTGLDYNKAAAVAVGPKCAHKSVQDLDMLPLQAADGDTLWPRCYCVLPGARVQSPDTERVEGL